MSDSPVGAAPSQPAAAPDAAPASAPAPLREGWAALHRRMRLASYLVACGLAVQAATLVWTRPPTFLVFLGVGAVLVTLGALMYLAAIARHPGHGAVEAPARERPAP